MEVAPHILRPSRLEHADTQASFIRDGLGVKYDVRTVAVVATLVVTHGLIEVGLYGV